MISAHEVTAQSTEIMAQTGNGTGYWSYIPQDPVSPWQGKDVMSEYGHYTEGTQVIHEAVANGSVLVEGEAGSGKSHLVRQLQEAAQVAGVPCFCLSLHINGGKATGIENIEGPLEEFLNAIPTTGGMVILDNVDYLGYKGSSSKNGRRRGPTTKHTNDAAGLIGELLQDSRLAIVGTAHTDEWRESHWTWNDPAIDEPARDILSKFKSSLVFEGKVALVGLVEIVMARQQQRAKEAEAQDGAPLEVSQGMAARIVRTLYAQGRGNFFHANHIDPILYLEDPAAALKKIDDGRALRTTRQRPDEAKAVELE